MNIKKEIENILAEILEKLNFDFEGEINLERPQDLKNGDWTTNLAMQIAGKSGKNPKEIGEEILAEIPKSESIEKVEIAGPGYLNFYLSDLFFLKFLERNLAEPNFALKNNNQKILLEHSSPNLFKPFHIGHLVNNSIGESMGRLLSFQGYQVKTVSFPSDVSPGIAKTIWALKKEGKDVTVLNLKEIADAYVVGTKKYKEDSGAKKEIDYINTEIYSYLNGQEINNKNVEFYEKGKEISLEYFKKMSARLGSSFNKIFYESEAEKIGKEIVKKNIPGVFKESEGAIIFEGEKMTNVFVNSQGFGTYLAKDIGLLKLKKDNFPEIRKSLVITDVEQKQHFEMIKEAGERISGISDFVQKSKYIQHGRMKFGGNIKISSRYGNVPLATEMIDSVQKNILAKMEGRDFSEEEKKEISEKLAIATLKYSILKVTSGKNITFDIEKDTNPQGDSAIFLLYSLVRAKSIFRSANQFKDILDSLPTEYSTSLPNILKKMTYFEEVVIKGVNDYSPHHLANYLYDLAQEFNSFYAQTKILDQGNLDKEVNFAILRSFIGTMERGLKLLAIPTIEKM